MFLEYVTIFPSKKRSVRLSNFFSDTDAIGNQVGGAGTLTVVMGTEPMLTEGSVTVNYCQLASWDFNLCHQKCIEKWANTIFEDNWAAILSFTFYGLGNQSCAKSKLWVRQRGFLLLKCALLPGCEKYFRAYLFTSGFLTVFEKAEIASSTH